MSKFPGVAGCSAKQFPVSDDSAADAAGATVEEDQVLLARAGAEEEFALGAERCVVGRVAGVSGGLAEHSGDGFIAPAQMRGVPDYAVVAVDEPGHRDAHAHDPVRSVELGPHSGDHGGGDVHGLFGRRDPLGVETDLLLDLPPEADKADGDGIDLRVDR